MNGLSINIITSTKELILKLLAKENMFLKLKCQIPILNIIRIKFQIQIMSIKCLKSLIGGKKNIQRLYLYKS